MDTNRFIREKFFDIVHVEDTKSATLKKKIYLVFCCHNLIIQNIRAQDYNGASTMQG